MSFEVRNLQKSITPALARFEENQFLQYQTNVLKIARILQERGITDSLDRKKSEMLVNHDFNSEDAVMLGEKEDFVLCGLDDADAQKLFDFYEPLRTSQMERAYQVFLEHLDEVHRSIPHSK